MLREAAYGAPLTSGVSALEQNRDALFLGYHPALQLPQFNLKLLDLFLVMQGFKGLVEADALSTQQFD